MIRRRVAAAVVASLFVSGCGLLGGASTTIGDQERLIAIVQRVALVPGVDALDPSGPTAVGTDWRQVVFTFTEPIAQSAIDAFVPSCNLEHQGLSLDPAHPPSFNTLGIGLIPPRTRLTVTFNAMAEGDYTITLVSGGICSSLASDAGATFTGTFAIHVSVAASDGKDPYIVTFRPDQSGVPDEIPPALYFVSAGHVPMGSLVPPHAKLEVAFSQEIRTPAPIEISPTIPGFPVGNIAGPVPDGIAFADSIQTITYDDTVEGHVANRRATVLTSQTPAGMDLDTDYTFAFRGIPPMTSYQGFIRDRSGQPLTVRFDSAPRDIATIDTRTLHTAPVRIDSPGLGSYVNAAAFASGPNGSASLTVGGTMADRIDHVELSLRSADGLYSTSFGPAARTVLAAQNAVGVPIDRFTGTAGMLAAFPDGEYVLSATAFLGGQTSGSDEVTITKDTQAPALAGGGDVEVPVTSGDVPDFCVRTLATDAVEAEVVFAGSVLATSTTPIPPSPFSYASGLTFCFSSFAIPPGALAGKNTWVIRFFDRAGNSADSVATLTLQPVIVSIEPPVASPGQIVTVLGYGLFPASDADLLTLGAARIPLSHSLDRANMQPEIFVDATGTVARSNLDRIRIRVPDFADSGALGFVLAGVASTTAVLDICTSPIAPFATGEVDQFEGSKIAFGLTGLLADEAPVAGSPDLAVAGLPVVFATRGATSGIVPVGPELDAIAPKAATAEWTTNVVFSLPIGSGDFIAVASAQDARGDAEVAFSTLKRQGPTLQSIYLARRALVAGADVWTPCAVALHGGVATSVPPALSLAFTPDGRAVVAYAAQLLAPNSDKAGLWISIQRATDSCEFDERLVDGVPGAVGTVAVAVGANGDIWIVYDRDYSQFLGALDFEIEAKRMEHAIFGGYLTTVLPSPGKGILRSIAIDPASQNASALFQEATSTPRPLFQLDVAFGDLFLASFVGGATWGQERITNEAPEVSTVGGLPRPVVNWDLDRRSARLIFQEGRPVIAHSGRNGGIRIWKALPFGHSIEDVADVTPAPGFLSVIANGGGGLRALFRDREQADLKLYRDEELRAVSAASSPAYSCPVPYARTSVATDISAIVATHSNFVFKLDPAALAAIATNGEEILLTAINRDGIELSAAQVDSFVSSQTFALPDTEYAAGLALPVLHAALSVTYEASTDPNNDPAAYFAELLFKPKDFTNFLRFEVDANPDGTPKQDGSAECCGSAGCSSAPGVVESCFSAFLPLSICASDANSTCAIVQLGKNLKDLKQNLPLLTAGGFSTDSLSGHIDTIDVSTCGTRAQQAGTCAAGPRIELLGEGDGKSSGTLSLNLPLHTITTTVRVTGASAEILGQQVGLCAPFDLNVTIGGDSATFELDGEPVFVRRGANGNQGFPTVGTLSGKILVDPGRIGFEATHTNDACRLAIANAGDKIRTGISDYLRSKAGERIGQSAGPLKSGILEPLLGELLGAAPTPLPGAPNEGVSLFVKPDGTLGIIYR